ncbi:carboxypeptidase-like regulatory domain-containing protein [Bacillus alkalicellulosilyticus]|uniref:carboxypeptidase-like regulatory domain-containing protein n=1 Tax=Alkalihalobacterium alkalicellulosilyticum TaxID=1912214 RepID=UPI00099744F2|nr:carboxypeptidase-like regulatory domain-containing protein [Bacillus alkalicellulosilyticus]
MKVEFKRKHILYGVSSFLILLLVAIQFVLPAVQEYQVKRMIAADHPNTGSEIIELIENATGTQKKLRLIEEYIISWKDRGERHPIYMSPGFGVMHGGSTQWSGFTDEEIEPYLYYYLEHGPRDWRYDEIIVHFTDEVRKEKGTETALQFLDEKEKELIEQGAPSYRETFFLKKSELLLEEGRIEEAIDILLVVEAEQIESYEEIDEWEYHPSQMWTTTMVEALLVKGDLEEALVQIEKWEKGEETWRNQFEDEDEVPVDSDHPLMSLKQTIKQMQENGSIQENGRVFGKITREDGTPLEGVFVYLRDEHNLNRSVHPDSERYVAKTNFEGEYEFPNVYSGDYQIGLGLQYSHVDGYSWPMDSYEWIHVKDGQSVSYDITLQPLIEVIEPVNEEIITEERIKFEWEPVKEAAYYSLSLQFHHEHAIYSRIVKEKITQSRVDISLVDIAPLLDGGYSTDNNGNVVLEPEKLLGFLNPNATISWSIQAFSEDGKELAQSNGYRLTEDTVGNIPFFTLKNRELSASDKLLLKEDTEGALKGYQKDYREDPQDLHALRMITVLLQPHLRDSEDEQLSEMYQSHLEVLAEQTNHPNYYIRLAELANADKNWETYNKWFTKYVSIIIKQGEPLIPNIAQDQAKALFQQGDLEGTRKWLNDGLEQERGNTIIADVLALELYIGTDKEEIVDIAKQHPYKYRKFKDLSALVKEVEVNQSFLEAVDTYFRDGREKAKAKLSTLEHAPNKKFIEFLIQ